MSLHVFTLFNQLVSVVIVIHTVQSSKEDYAGKVNENDDVDTSLQTKHITAVLPFFALYTLK